MEQDRDSDMMRRRRKTDRQFLGNKSEEAKRTLLRHILLSFSENNCKGYSKSLKLGEIYYFSVLIENGKEFTSLNIRRRKRLQLNPKEQIESNGQ
jgi:hypothetical protein